MLVKVGRWHEKRWGIIFKCLTTRAVHLDLLNNMDADAYLMAMSHFITQRGALAELCSMAPTLQKQLTSQIKFHFNLPAAPHFRGG